MHEIILCLYHAGVDLGTAVDSHQYMQMTHSLCRFDEQKADTQDSTYDGFVELVKEMWHQEPESRPPLNAIVDKLSTLFEM